MSTFIFPYLPRKVNLVKGNGPEQECQQLDISGGWDLKQTFATLSTSCLSPCCVEVIRPLSFKQGCIEFRYIMLNYYGCWELKELLSRSVLITATALWAHLYVMLLSQRTPDTYHRCRHNLELGKKSNKTNDTWKKNLKMHCFQAEIQH